MKVSISSKEIGFVLSPVVITREERMRGRVALKFWLQVMDSGPPKPPSLNFELFPNFGHLLSDMLENITISQMSRKIC